MSTASEVSVSFTDDELSAVIDGANATNLHYGPIPDPPTPIMRALKKLEEAREHASS